MYLNYFCFSLGFIILNWRALEHLGPTRCQFLMIIIFIILINLLMGASSKNIDNWGHLGGFLVGFVSSIALFIPLREDSRTANYKKIAMGITVAFFLFGFIGFFVGREPLPWARYTLYVREENFVFWYFFGVISKNLIWGINVVYKYLFKPICNPTLFKNLIKFAI